MASGKLAEIAAADPDLRPYADLLGIALAATREQVWDGAVSTSGLAIGEPALHGRVLTLPQGATEGLWQRVAGGFPHRAGERDLGGALGEALALRAEGEDATLLQLTLLPRLMAVGRACAAAVSESEWASGVCPVCAAWPALAESRGLDRMRVLRCGRCGSGWQLPWQLCPFCANGDHAGISYLYSEQLGEARRVFACERCRGYLKTIATLGAIDPLDVPVEDLASLELDLAALEAGFQRPNVAGFELGVELNWAD